jgi:hypothetical protein
MAIFVPIRNIVGRRKMNVPIRRRDVPCDCVRLFRWKEDAVLLFSICLGSELILIGVRRFYRPSVPYNLEDSIVVATTFLVPSLRV